MVPQPIQRIQNDFVVVLKRVISSKSRRIFKGLQHDGKNIETAMQEDESSTCDKFKSHGSSSKN